MAAAARPGRGGGSRAALRRRAKARHGRAAVGRRNAACSHCERTRLHCLSPPPVQRGNGAERANTRAGARGELTRGWSTPQGSDAPRSESRPSVGRECERGAPCASELFRHTPAGTFDSEAKITFLPTPPRPKQLPARRGDARGASRWIIPPPRTPAFLV